MKAMKRLVYHINRHAILILIAVDKENIDSTIIKDGFHMKEEIYRN